MQQFLNKIHKTELFYNRKLQCLIALELKKGKFEPEYAGKMNFYLNLLDDFVREPHERDCNKNCVTAYSQLT